MNILLFAPALFFILLLSNGFFDTYFLLLVCGFIQCLIALEFFFNYPLAYLSRAFELNRVFFTNGHEQGGLINLLKRLWFGIRTRLDTHDVLFALFTANLIGITFARSLHYQFYCWYYHSIPYLLFSPVYRFDHILYKGDNDSYNNITIPFKSVLFRVPILFLIEVCWNIYPSTFTSSFFAALPSCNYFIFGFQLSNEKNKKY